MLKPPNMPMYEYLYSVITPICARNAAIHYQADRGLPDAYAVYYLVSSVPEAHFSDSSRRENQRYSVVYYDRDKRNIEPKGNEIKKAMSDAGFIYIGKSSDIEHVDTNHWSTTYDFRHYEED